MGKTANEPQAPGAVEALLIPAEVAALVRINYRTIRRKVVAGSFPRPIMVSARRPRWRPEDIRAWLAKKAKAG